MRNDYGFARTTCACKECTLNCQYIPGYLTPLDLERLAPVTEGFESVMTWAREHLLASPGAKVMRDGIVFNIPTLVPARKPDGNTCHWLTYDNKCSIHADAPFGCAMFDCHQLRAEGDLRSSRGLWEIVKDGGSSLYGRVWCELVVEDRVIPCTVEESRRQLRIALGLV